MLIYKATNIINNKVYIGQTRKTLEERKLQHIKKSHRSKDDCRFHKALREYGEENFIFEIIEDDISTQLKLNEREIFWINFYDSYNVGYNSTLGGDDNPMNNREIVLKHNNKVKSEEWRKNHSEIMKKVVAERGFTLEHRKRISDKLKGNQHGKGKKRPQSAIDATSKALNKSVYCIDSNGKIINRFNSVKDGALWWQTEGVKASIKSICGYIKKSSRNNVYIRKIKWIYE